MRGVYHDERLNEDRCTPGQQELPTGCQRHSRHYWCAFCQGWYGVPHELPDGCCTQTQAAPTRGGQCACRFCVMAELRGREWAYEWRELRQIEARPHGAVDRR